MAFVLKRGVIERLLPQGESVIGRHKGCDIYINDEAASRTHCKVVVEGGEITVEDLQSSNGTYVDEIPVREPTRLPLGGKLRVGDTVFELSLSHRTTPPPPSPKRESDVPILTRTHSRAAILTRSAERALAEDKVEQARTILEPALRTALESLGGQEPIDANTMGDLAMVAASAAAKKPDPDWNAWPLRLYGAAKFCVPFRAAKILAASINKAGLPPGVAAEYRAQVAADLDEPLLRRAIEAALRGEKT